MPGVHGPGCGCKHEKELVGAKFLLPFINVEGIQAFNEKITDSAKTVFKNFEERLDDTKFCDSEGDPELIVTIPFISPCKISSFHLIGGEDSYHPSSVKLYINQDNLDFSMIEEIEPLQTVTIYEDYHGAIEYPLKTAKFTNVNSLTMYFPTNNGGEFTRIYYIGLRGEGTNYKRSAVITVYEASPNLADHEVPKDEVAPSFMF